MIGKEIPPPFSSFDRAALRSLLLEVAKPGIQIAEIGSYVGNGSTLELIASAKINNGLVHCIDTWKGSQNVDDHLVQARECDLYQTFLYNVNAADGLKNVKIMRMESLEAARMIPDRFFDLVFIDADHSYASVCLDIELWKDKVKSGGILCGHDCEGKSSDFGFDLSQLIKKEPLINALEVEGLPMRHCHPGVVLAVEQNFKESATLWVNRMLTLDDNSAGRSSIWSVRQP